MKKIITSVAAFVLAAATLPAQSGTWTLKDCIDHALSHNVQVKKDQAAVQSAAIDRKEAKAGMLPTLSASVNQALTYRPFQETGGNFVNGGITSSSAKKATQSGSYGINASWTLWDAGKRKMNIQNADLSQQQSELDAQASANSIQEQITQLYIQILYMKEAVSVNRQLLKQDSTLYVRGKEMLAQQQISKADLAQLEAQVSSGRYEVVNTLTQIESTKTQLKQLLELDQGRNSTSAMWQ